MNFSCFQNLQSVHCANSALQRNLSVRFQLGSCKQSHYKQALIVFTRGEEEEGNPGQPDKPIWVTSPQGSEVSRLAHLGAVLGAAGAIAITSALPSAPAEAADVSQTLSRM